MLNVTIAVFAQIFHRRRLKASKEVRLLYLWEKYLGMLLQVFIQGSRAALYCSHDEKGGPIDIVIHTFTVKPLYHFSTY